MVQGRSQADDAQAMTPVTPRMAEELHCELHHTPRECLSCVPHFRTMDVDSTEVFMQRARHHGLTKLEERFKTLLWATYSLFALAVPSTGNGMVDADLFTKNVVDVLCEEENKDEGQGPSPHAAGIRRLWFESHVISVGDLLKRIDREDDDAPRRVAPPERDARKQKLRDRLAPGLRVQGKTDPGDSVINRFLNIIDTSFPTDNRELEAKPFKSEWPTDSR